MLTTASGGLRGTRFGHGRHPDARRRADRQGRGRISPAGRQLASATIIAAEDTRRVRWLAASLNIQLAARIVSYHDSVEARRTAGLIDDLKAGHDVLLVTDAGTPGIS